MTDAELLDLGDILWAADYERFLPSEMSLNIENEGRSVGISDLGILLIDRNYRSLQLAISKARIQSSMTGVFEI